MVVVFLFFIHFLNKCRIYLVLRMNGNMSPLSFMCSCAVKNRRAAGVAFHKLHAIDPQVCLSPLLQAVVMIKRA